MRGMLSGADLARRAGGWWSRNFCIGEEASFIVMTDGEHILPFASSQDHKARDNGDRGPNTGGMGAYSPAPVVTPELHDRIMAESSSRRCAAWRRKAAAMSAFSTPG
jgi:phosphoribosylamine--glycine ligase